MGKTGELILVTGFFGAGKSTLTHEALDAFEDLEYLKTVTDRPRREKEVKHGSAEYIFVSSDEYAAMQQRGDWDHMHLQGYNYGADVGSANRRLAQGIGFICCTAPDMEVISQMGELYDASPVVVWINTPLDIANRRLRESGDERRIARIGHWLQSEATAEQVRQIASIIFEPTHDLATDTDAFVYTVGQIMGGGRFGT